MRASEVLQKCLSDGLEPMHALRHGALLRAVDALMAGQRLTLFDLARSWPDASRISAPLKAIDRLLSNRHLHADSDALYRALACWLIPRQSNPVILVDWSDLKEDRSWCLLRAAVPLGGRSMTILDEVHPLKDLGSPRVQRDFLHHLRALLPSGVRPIVVADAGFRTPWLRELQQMGWFFVVRLRGWTRVKPLEEADLPENWVGCRDTHYLAQPTPREFPIMQTNRSNPITTRMILWKKPAKGRKMKTRDITHRDVRSSSSRKSAAREREPWVLLASEDLPLNARAVVKLYARRMQVELAFRDLKSHRFGLGFEDSLTRKRVRIDILLLLSTLAIFAAWLVGLAAEATGLAGWLDPRKSKRRLYSLLRLGRETLKRPWYLQPIRRWIAHLRTLPKPVTDQVFAA